MKNSNLFKMCTVHDERLSRLLAEKSTVACSMCGAKSHLPEYVCDPVQLPDVGYFGD